MKEVCLHEKEKKIIINIQVPILMMGSARISLHSRVMQKY